MARITEEQRREIVADRLAARVRSDPRFSSAMKRFQDQYPMCFPLSRESLATGIPILFVLELAVLARDVGLDRLPAPWFLIARSAMDLAPRPKPAGATASIETWQRYADWFFDHFRTGRTLVQISDSYRYDLETVRSGVRSMTKLFHTSPPPRGRPRKTHYAS